MFWTRIPDLRVVIPKFISEQILAEDELKKIKQYIVNWLKMNGDRESLQDIEIFEGIELITDDVIKAKIDELDQHLLFEFASRDLLNLGIDPF